LLRSSPHLPAPESASRERPAGRAFPPNFLLGGRIGKDEALRMDPYSPALAHIRGADSDLSSAIRLFRNGGSAPPVVVDQGGSHGCAANETCGRGARYPIPLGPLECLYALFLDSRMQYSEGPFTRVSPPRSQNSPTPRRMGLHAASSVWAKAYALPPGFCPALQHNLGEPAKPRTCRNPGLKPGSASLGCPVAVPNTARGNRGLL
jgi:hypothetical protein